MVKLSNIRSFRLVYSSMSVRNTRPYSVTPLLTIFFSSRLKFIIRFVSLHMGPTYSMVNFKKDIYRDSYENEA
jgi:hypothetical protein